jgi:hypothetical protein
MPACSVIVCVESYPLEVLHVRAKTQHEASQLK